MTRSYEQLCPIARTLDIVGDRWTLLILRNILFGASKFSELQAGLPGIPARVLSQRLKRLEEHGLIARQVYSEHPLRAAYHLTAEGESLKPVLSAIASWGMEHMLSDDERRLVAQQVAAQVPDEGVRALFQAYDRS